MLYHRPRPHFWQRHPWMSGTGALLLGWLLLNGLYLPAAVMALIVLLIVARGHRRAAESRDAGLRARADYEHRLTLSGDPRGMYGRYPPVQAGWFPDPHNPRQLRYFDGALWTQHAVGRWQARSR